MNKGVDKVCFIGVGGCGQNIGDYISQRDEFEYACINSDANALSESKARSKLLIGNSIVKGDGCGGDAVLGKLSAETDRLQMKTIVQGAGVVFLCAGMGGGTGGGATSTISQVALEAGAKVVVLAVMPFEFEGDRPLQAKVAVSNLPSEVSYIEFCNEKLIEVLGGKATIEDAFGAMNDCIGKVVSLLITRFNSGNSIYQERSTCPFVTDWRL